MHRRRLLGPAILAFVWPGLLIGQASSPSGRAVESALAGRVFPGAVLLIGNRDGVLFQQGYGHLTWTASSPAPTPESTVWDLASLTKVIATTGVAARLVDRGVLDLNAPVSRYLPGFSGGDRNRVTVRMLLDHTSGLPAWLALWREAASPADVVARISAEPLRRPPGTEPVYSDLNAILMAAVLAQAGGAPFERLVQQEVITPLGLGQTTFHVAPRARSNAAPTSREPGAIVRGEVHDLNAAFLGGVSGHAGLFSTGHDVARVARAWLGGGSLDGAAWLTPATVAVFLSRSPVSGTRMLGWDTPDTTMATPSSFGRHPGPSVFGHTGWTGTQMWMDRDRNRFVVFLTNRAYEPVGANTFDRMRDARTAVADAVHAMNDRCLAEPAAAC